MELTAWFQEVLRVSNLLKEVKTNLTLIVQFGYQNEKINAEIYEECIIFYTEDKPNDFLFYYFQDNRIEFDPPNNYLKVEILNFYEAFCEALVSSRS